MQIRAPIAVSHLFALAALLAPLAAQDPATTAVQVPADARAPGLKVSWSPLDPEQRQKDGVHSERVRVLSVCVERGETPTPRLPPGMFEATFRGLLTLPVRDRYRFRVEGKGSFELRINGEKVLGGTLRSGKAEETAQPIRLQKGDNEVVARIESSALGEAQLRVAWSGPDFAFEPIAPERWQWPLDDAEIAAGEQQRRGHRLFVERRCVACHQTEQPMVSAFGELDARAPDLRAVGARLRPEFFAEWLQDPRAVRPDAVMPRFAFEKKSDIADLAAWLRSLGSPLAEATPPAVPAELVDRGADRFRELGCIACHVPPDQPTTPASQHGRMPLAFVARKWWPSALEQYLLDPQREHPGTRMPSFALSTDDAKALAAYLVRLAPQSQPLVPGDADNGRRLAQRHGCDRCHDVAIPETGRRFQELRALHADHGCLADAPGAAPDHGLAADDRAALRAFLPGAAAAIARRSPLDYAARNLSALRCTHCHGIDGRASTWARIATDLSAAEPLPPEQDPIAQGLPALTWVGAKLQPGWMERFVTGKEPSPRPWLHARMPSFGQPGAIVVSGLVRGHGFASSDEPEAALDAQLAAHGARLVKIGEGFGCVQCHGVGKTPPVQVFERQGINFAVSAVRLRRDYYLRWLLDPMRIDPDARMPKFADAKGKTAFTEVLDGDARRQFEAIWHWFRTIQ